MLEGMTDPHLDHLLKTVESVPKGLWVGRLLSNTGRGATVTLRGGRWWWLAVFGGRCQLHAGGVTTPLSPGDVVLVSAPTPCQVSDAIGRGFRLVRVACMVAGAPPVVGLPPYRRVAPHVAGVLQDLATAGAEQPTLRRHALLYLLAQCQEAPALASAAGIRAFSKAEIIGLHGAVSGNYLAWDAERLARHLRCSVMHLRRRFRATWGVNPRDWLQSLRLRQGAVMLRQGQETVAAIAEHLAYGDQAQFSKQFTVLYGVPPTTFRRQGGSDWVDLRVWGEAKRGRRVRPPGGRGGGARDVR